MSSPHNSTVEPKDAMTPPVDRPSLWTDMRTSEDWWSIWCAVILLTLSFAAVWIGQPAGLEQSLRAGEPMEVVSPLKPWLATPDSWTDNPLSAFAGKLPGIVGGLLTIGILFAIAIQIRGKSAVKFLIAFPVVFLLATLAYVMAEQSVASAYNLEYALWALLVGLIISNTIGTPAFIRPAMLTEFFIKTGLVLLGAEVLMSRLLALGLPGIFVAWVVTPVVLVSTYIFGQKILKMESKSLNMVISADMSVCGVSAAIATAAACKAKKEELSLSIGLSLSFTVIMMVVMPAIIKAVGMDPILGGAWLGGTIDSTGAVAAAVRGVGGRSVGSRRDRQDDPEHLDRRHRFLRCSLLGDLCRA